MRFLYGPEGARLTGRNPVVRETDRESRLGEAEPRVAVRGGLGDEVHGRIREVVDARRGPDA